MGSQLTSCCLSLASPGPKRRVQTGSRNRRGPRLQRRVFGAKRRSLPLCLQDLACGWAGARWLCLPRGPVPRPREKRDLPAWAGRGGPRPAPCWRRGGGGGGRWRGRAAAQAGEGEVRAGGQTHARSAGRLSGVTRGLHRCFRPVPQPGAATDRHHSRVRPGQLRQGACAWSRAVASGDRRHLPRTHRHRRRRTSKETPW